MARKELDDRKRRILKVITDDYINSAEPVGSRTIARKYDLGLSPATIRNEMADLEEEGYLQQPHTSAGRIPSDRGYRFYVDALMERRRLRTDEVNAIKRELAAKERAFDSILHQAAHVLAQVTRYPSLVLSPDQRSTLFKYIKLIRLNERSVLMLIIADTGQVEHRLFDCSVTLGESELEQLSALMNERLKGRPISEFKASLFHEISLKLRIGEELIHQALQDLVEGMCPEPSRHVVTEGASQILDQPEFSDRERFRPLLDLLEQEDALYRLLEHTRDLGGRGVNIVIGQENREQAVRDCSVVTAAYEVQGRTVGTIGILGPTRMDYRKVLAVLDFMAAHLSSVLNDLAGR